MDRYPENLDCVNKNFKPQVYINFFRKHLFPGHSDRMALILCDSWWPLNLK